VVVSEGYYERRIAHKSIHCSNGGQHEEFFDIIFDKDDNVLYSGFEEALERWGLWHQKNECVCRRSNGVIDYGEEYEGWVPPVTETRVVREAWTEEKHVCDTCTQCGARRDP
jgi:hypothetical protein